MSPFDLHRQIYGPKAHSKAVFYITCALFVVLFLIVFGGALAMVPA